MSPMALVLLGVGGAGLIFGLFTLRRCIQYSRFVDDEPIFAPLARVFMAVVFVGCMILLSAFVVDLVLDAGLVGDGWRVG